MTFDFEIEYETGMYEIYDSFERDLQMTFVAWVSLNVVVFIPK